MTKNLSPPPIVQNQTFWPHRYMYIMYIYNILEHNSPNCPGEQLQGPLVKISPKSCDRWEYGWALSYMLCSYFCSTHHCTIVAEHLWAIPTNTNNQTKPYIPLFNSSLYSCHWVLVDHSYQHTSEPNLWPILSRDGWLMTVDWSSLVNWQAWITRCWYRSMNKNARTKQERWRDANAARLLLSYHHCIISQKGWTQEVHIFLYQLYEQAIWCSDGELSAGLQLNSHKQDLAENPLYWVWRGNKEGTVNMTGVPKFENKYDEWNGSRLQYLDIL